MSELERLRTELRRSAPPLPPVANQWSKLASDTRARLAPPRGPATKWAVSALAMIAIAMLATWRMRNAAPSASSIEVRAVAAPQSLDDGTTIALDPGASGNVTEARADYVRYELRRGRAHFDVTPNRRRSFQVSASGYEVRVLGTRFDVEVLAEGERVAVSVERGSVSVTPPGGASPVILRPGDRMDGPREQPEVHRDGATGSSPSGANAVVEPIASSGADGANEPTAAPAPHLAAAARSAGRNTASRESAGAPAPDWFALYRDGKYAASIAAARASGLQRLLRELDAEHLAALADAARFGGDTRDAAAALTALERRFPGTTEAAQATFLLGRLHALSGDAATAIADFERYLDRHPTGTYATEATGRLAELYSKRGNRQQAKAMAQRYLERAPDGPYARLARSLTNP